MGRSAFFIRTFGCALHCPWCDSAGTWHKDYVPATVLKLTEEQLVKEAVAAHPDFVVVTGGEPCHHDLLLLTHSLRGSLLESHLETSGSFDIKGQFDWITLSPKRSKLPLPFNCLHADEFKLIIENSSDIDYWADLLEGYWKDKRKIVWLHPEWSKRNDPLVLKAITDCVKDHGSPFRAGYQIHKLYRADSHDNRTQPLVPLGGNPALGI